MRSRGHPSPPVAGPIGAPRDHATSAPPRSARLRDPLLAVGGAGVLALALHVRDPHTTGSWGLCPWLLLTGSFCPGCGSLRAVNDLTHGDLLGAASSNLLLVAMLPLVALWWLRWTRRAWSGEPRPGTPSAGRTVTGPAAVVRDLTYWWVALGTVVTVVFAVLRNLPAGAWLAP